jgi:hypothetical protein
MHLGASYDEDLRRWHYPAARRPCIIRTWREPRGHLTPSPGGQRQFGDGKSILRSVGLPLILLPTAHSSTGGRRRSSGCSDGFARYARAA